MRQPAMTRRRSTLRTTAGFALVVHEMGVGPQVLLALHQIAGYGLMWASLARCMASGFEVVMPDMRGHGDSDAPGAGYTARDYAEDMIQVMDELGCWRFAVVGHSLGTRVGVHLAANWPDRVSHLIALEGVHGFSFPQNDNGDVPQIEKDHLTGRPCGPFQLETAEAYIRERKPRLSTEVLRHMLGHSLRECDGGLFEWKLPEFALSATLDSAGEDLSLIAKRIGCPVLMLLSRPQLVCGKKAENPVPRLKKYFLTATWQILKGNWDYSYIEAPQLVAEEIAAFIAAGKSKTQ